ncbi:MAG: hypothetical protein GXO09_06555, partial [Crenarchaeota archaeon]|nr:hypothetical protein [Thermoproteota archaeon]
MRPVADYVKTVAAIYCGTVCSEAQEAALNNNNGDDIVDILAQIRALYGEEGACNYLLTLTLTRLADRLLTKLLESRRASQLDDEILREALEEALRELEEQLRREENYHARFRELA